tara:strand:+ start:903 stop:1115 length:213 start_codon:yes stop_codon:yes gene_type:complete
MQEKKTIVKKKRGRPKKAQDQFVPSVPIPETLDREKNAFERKFGEGTAFDLDYGKLLIIALCIYIAVQVS